MMRACKICHCDISAMHASAVTCAAHRIQWKNQREVVRQQRYRARLKHGLPATKTRRISADRIDFPAGLEQAYATAIAIDVAVRNGKCCRHNDVDELKPGLGLCLKCWHS